MNRPDCLVQQVCSKKGNGNSFIPAKKPENIFYASLSPGQSYRTTERVSLITL